MRKIYLDDYEVTWVNYEHGIDPDNSNLDVHVNFKNGSSFVATFFTLKNLQQLFLKYKETGECANGTYFWAADMIIVQEMTKENIVKTVQQLIEDEEFEKAFDASLNEGES